MERKKAGTQKQQQTEHKMMIEVCLRLGYQLEAIQRVITLNGRPFPKISELIDALYVAADGGDISSITSNGLTEPVVNNRTMTQAVIPEEDRQRCFLAADSAGFMPGRMDGHKSFPDSEGACIMCYRKTGQNNPANHIGLPCGHMIYCENCNKEEMQRLAAYQAYKPLCPYKHCGTLLTASFKTYYA
ncbi:hypothetical protein EB796_003332 [Bugula neritina]|uniref:RING-type domain-containing protein n=1 Tax=Bugula neritina TaxID=10212 RepID=A0A7J7KJB9_BUGNE|nr:hypothetical protein EB796_003332 [Bugula neritina]